MLEGIAQKPPLLQNLQLPQQDSAPSPKPSVFVTELVTLDFPLSVAPALQEAEANLPMFSLFYNTSPIMGAYLMFLDSNRYFYLYLSAF